jgi:copper chaperone NosL
MAKYILRLAVLKENITMAKRLFLVLFIYTQLVLLIPVSFGNTEATDTVAENVRCPVCGMFVAKYPNWLAQIHYDSPDKTKVFDGVKDMMVFYFNPQKYGGTSRETIKDIFVKDYYSLKSLKAKEAFYVIGSDVYGPMGHELIPFESKEAAESFSKDHLGKDILTFDQITPDLIESLRMNQKMR